MFHASRASGRNRPALAAALALALATGCGSGPESEAPDFSGYLFMTDTYSGKVFTYDPATHAGSAASLATVGQNGAGEIEFLAGIGYVCVGSGTGAGLYRFDPAAANPAFARIGIAVNAQYLAFASDAKAYLTVASDWTGNLGELYSFDPSNPEAGLTQVSAVAKYAQGAIIGADAMLYVAQDKDSGEVLKIDPADDSVKATYSTGMAGTTGLLWGTFNGNPGVFVASTAGSIDFIAQGAAAGAAATVVATSEASPIYPARLVQLANGNLVATGFDLSYVNHTYLVALSGAAAVVTELKAGGASFGSLDIDYTNGLVYVPFGDYTNKTSRLYVFDGDGVQASYSPVTVMTTGTDLISNIALYED
jgi:hypothetical protein